MSKKHKVIFQPSGRRGEVEEGQTLLQAAQALGVDIEALCGNKKVCGKCKVRIEEGYFEKDNLESGMNHIFPPVPSPDELKHIKPQDGPGIRLACQCEVRGDLKVFVPERSRAGKQVVRKAAKELTIKLDPAVKKYNVELKPPTLHDMTTGDWERVLKFLEDDLWPQGPYVRLSCAEGPSGRPAQGRMEGHGHGLDGQGDHESRTGLCRSKLRSRGGHRNHNLRRLSYRPEHGQGSEYRVHDEPPGPLWRRCNVTHHLCHEQSGRGPEDHAEGDHSGPE